MENKMPFLGKINCRDFWKIDYHLQSSTGFVNMASRTAGNEKQELMDSWNFRMMQIIRSSKKVFTDPLTVDIDRSVNGAIDKKIQYL